MPLVVVQYKPGSITEGKLKDFVSVLPKLVARALHVPENPDAHLTPEDVEVWVRESGKLDRNVEDIVKDIEIVIWANEYPERLQNLGERKDRIVQSIRDFFYGRIPTGFVWVLLQPAAFGEL